MKTSEDRRLRAVLEVWAGRQTAVAAARGLGISRKTFYQWEARALEGLRRALTPGRGGRPARRPDGPQTRLAAENRQLREEVRIWQQRERIRSLLGEAMSRAQKKSGGPGRG